MRKSGFYCTVHEPLGKLTVFSKRIDSTRGYPEITLNIRYPLGISCEKIVENAEKSSDKVGFSVISAFSVTEPYMLDPENDAVKALCRVANEVTGDDKAPFTIKGGTYAHKLPNAYVFGTNGNLPPEDFPKGRGGARGIDEAISLDRLKRVMKIYARALLALNNIEW